MHNFLSSSLFCRRISRSEIRIGAIATRALFLAIGWMAFASLPVFAGTATTTTLAVTSGGDRGSWVKESVQLRSTARHFRHGQWPGD